MLAIIGSEENFRGRFANEALRIQVSDSVVISLSATGTADQDNFFGFVETFNVKHFIATTGVYSVIWIATGIGTYITDIYGVNI